MSTIEKRRCQPELSSEGDIEQRVEKTPQKPPRQEQVRTRRVNMDVVVENQRLDQERGVRERIQDALVRHHEMEFVLNNIDPNLLKKIKPQDQLLMLDKMASEFRYNPELRKRFQEILIDGNQDRLKEDSALRAKALMEGLFADVPKGLKGFFSRDVRRERARRQDRFNAFQEWINTATVERGDQTRHEVFKSPRKTGVAISFGLYDLVAQSDRYVYASLSIAPHAMTGSGSDRVNRIYMDDVRDRGELVMMDIADLAPRSGEHVVEHYLNNVFSFVEGKQALAAYLAQVFESVDEAEEWLRYNGGNKQRAQQWESMLLEGRLVDREHKTREEWQADQKRADVRMEEIKQKMVRMLEVYGIEPPLQMEVRIRDEVRSVRGETGA